MPEKYFDWLPTKPALTPKRTITATPNYSTKLKIQPGPVSLVKPYEKSKPQQKLIILPAHLKQTKKIVTQQDSKQVNDLEMQIQAIRQLENSQPNSLQQQKQQKLLLCEQLSMSLETLQNIMPETQSVIILLKEGLDLFKPNVEVHDQEIQEMLKERQTQDSQIGINLSGLARVIVKKQREQYALEQRKKDLEQQMQDLRLTQLVNEENEKILNDEIKKFEMLIEAKKAIKV